MAKEIRYIPVSYMTGLNFILDKKIFNYKNKKFTLWENDSFFQHPITLVSTFHALNWKTDDIRKEYNVPKNYIIMGDSGGFQNMTMNACLDPITVLRWQEKNCDIGLIFDLPINGEDTPQRIKEKQKQTAINAKKAYDNRNNKNLKLYAIFQGHTIKQQDYMEKCYNENVPLNKFDGIAIGGLVPIAGSTEKLIKILTLFCYKVKDYKLPLHFFGLSGNKIIPYIKYLAETFDLEISFDSSSYTAGGRRREFWIKNGKNKINCMQENYNKIPCDCPVCSVVQDWKVYQGKGSLPGGLISLHNLYQTIQYVKEINKKEDLNIKESYKKFITTMKEKGPEKAFNFLEPLQEPNMFIQKSLFGNY